SSFFPRTENSKGEASAADFIETRLKDSDIKYTRYELSESETVNSWSVTIDAIIPGKSGNEIFMIFPLNHPPEAIPGRDGSANLAAALYLVEKLQNTELPQTVHIVFMGAEFGEDSTYPLGTKDYLANYYPELNSAFFYFDFKFIPEVVRINYSGTGSISPLWILKKSINSLDTAKLPFSTEPGISLINKLGLNNKPSVIDYYFSNEYPVIHFEGSYSGYYTPERDKVLSLFTFLTELALRGGGLIPSNPEWDSHYLYLKLMNHKLIINETSYVLFLLVLVSLIIIYPSIASKRFQKYKKTVTHHFWNIPVIFFVMFFLLWTGTIVSHIILKIQSFPTLWEIVPFHFLTLKLSMAVLIFLLTLRLFKGIHFSRRGTFYSAAALIFIIIDLLILISIDIAFSYYLLPVLIFIFAFTIFRNRWIKLLFLILSVLILMTGTGIIFFLNAKRVINLILLSPVAGNLIITANLLPVTLLIFRLQFLFHQKNKKITKTITIGGDILLTVISVGLFIYLTTFNPYTGGRLQPVRISENISIDSGVTEVTLISPSPLGEFTYNTSFLKTTLDISETSYTVTTSAPAPEDLPTIKMTSTSFLNRKQYIITVDSLLVPNKISAVLKGEKEILLFDSNFHVKNKDNKTTEFLIGANPKIPLNFSFTLPGEFTGEMSIKLEFADYPSKFK
ncbi:MAG: hypothetical protein KAR21_12970, partial [Spirochaetales bacterium]|nr:hypothetical protein [Spirochaetales bacterium]